MANGSEFFICEPKSGFESFIDSGGAKRKIEDIVAEYGERQRLRASGIEPARKILVSGPGGAGKTLLAEITANLLGMKLAIVQNCNILMKGSNGIAKAFHDIFKWIGENPAVYLFEHMWLPNDKGILDIQGLESVFFQLLGMERGDSVIMVESWHIPPGWQGTQFDSEITLENSGSKHIREILDEMLRRVGARPAFIGKEAMGVAEGLPNSSIARACRRAIRKSVIAGTELSLADLEDFFRQEKAGMGVAK